MKASDLKMLIEEGESTTLEFKENLSGSFARELVGLANTIGGKILLGVRDDRSVAGVKDSNALRARIQDLARNCDPPVTVSMETLGNVMVIHVRESDAKPVQCSDGFFWRQGAATQKLSRTEIRDYFRAEGAIRFDLAVCSKFNYPSDFDRRKFEAWLKLSGITGKTSVEDMLVNIDAAERSEGRLLFRNVGVLFFAKNIRRFFNQAYVTCLLAKGTGKAHILDRKDFEGGIVADIEEAMRFVERNTRTAYRIERLQRENVPEYPMNAVREAIANAVMHRDWFADGANVFVEIYTDRIEVISPGGLPKGMRPADLGRKAVRRNPLIADLLHRIAFIEKAGTGISRMRDDAKDNNYPEPAFDTNGFFTVTFRPNPDVRTKAQSRSKSPAEASHRPSRQTPSTDQVEGPSQGPSQRPSQGPSRATQSRDPVERLLAALGDQDLAAVDLLRILGFTHKAAFRRNYLRPALDAGLIERTIPEKPNSRLQRYRLTRAGAKRLPSTKESK